MEYNIFISYASKDQGIVENLKNELKLLSKYVHVWMYSSDRTLTDDLWNEIEREIKEADLVIFIFSKHISTSTGQERELDIVHENNIKSMPIFLDGVILSEVPEKFSRINGEFLNAGSVKSTACKIIKHVFPALLSRTSSESWKYPRPGEWLKITNLDPDIEIYLNVGDKLYFRSVSPIGLFECYSPRINGLCWIIPDNVEVSYDFDDDKILESKVPFHYTISGLIHILDLGWGAWRTKQEKNKAVP